METMKLRVKPIVEIPHTVTILKNRFIFAPDEDVPKEIGERMIKAQPNLYEIAKGEPDMSKYTEKKEEVARVLNEVIQDLSPEDRVEVIKFIDKLKEKNAKAKAEADKKAKAEADKNNKKPE